MGRRFNNPGFTKSDLEFISNSTTHEQEVFLTILGKVIDDKNNKKDFRDNK